MSHPVMQSLLVLTTLLLLGQGRPHPFVLSVEDAQTRRGVPLVELRTVSNDLYVTDSAGIVAIDDPSLMNREVYFQVRAFGYETTKDAFDFRGKAFTITPGGTATLRIGRRFPAERIYRVTGEGIYR